jgi:hypothetical protein
MVGVSHSVFLNILRLIGRMKINTMHSSTVLVAVYGGERTRMVNHDGNVVAQWNKIH